MSIVRKGSNVLKESRLIARAREGDEEAFGELVRAHQDRVYRTAARMVGPDEAWDIAQEVFIRAFGEIERFRGDSALSTWLYRMTVNTSLNFLRGEGREKDRREGYGPGVSDPAPRPDRGVETEETERLVWEAVDSLPERQRTALVLHRFEGLTAPQIAEVMDATTGAVESLLHRAKESLLGEFQRRGLGPA
ncbi:MAG: sigma-70 family RNA polymerase sigma factor [bacterium]